MTRKLLTPTVLLLAGLFLLVPAERATRLARDTASLGHSDTPWVRYVMVGMGGFRGVVSEVLWIRADRLQQQGRYMELVQLSDWITALDPRATEGWVFNAWNLAYNITAMLPDYNARLSWLQAGISLLRDKALPANPNTPRLYQELGWLYQNKIGTSGDSAHIVYKLALAREFNEDGSRIRIPRSSLGSDLDPRLVQKIEKRFGKIDWRLANAHALYWACKGLELHPTGYDEESLRRMVQQTLVAMVFDGHFTGNVEKGIYQTSPAFELVPGLEAFFEETIAARESEKPIYSIVLARLVGAFAKADLENEARETYRKLEAIAEETDITLPSYEEVAAGTPLKIRR